MKKTINKYYIVIAAFLVFIACQNPSDPIYMAPGTGLLSLSLDKADTARTIQPAAPQNSTFAVFELKFFNAGTTNVYTTVDRTGANFSTPVSLAVGTYDLQATAYVDAGKTSPGAQGSVTGIVISNGQTTSKSLELKTNFSAGGGTFGWNIDYPAAVTFASMTITPLSSGGTATQTIGGSAPFSKQGSSTLNSGEYRVEFYLRDNKGQTAELKEILHVYQNLTSNFTFTFEAKNFHFLKVKQVIFPTGQNTTAVTFEGLSNNDIYLVKVNSSNNDITNSGSTGRVLDLLPSLNRRSEERLPLDMEEESPRMGHPGADEFNRNPPPILSRGDLLRREAETLTPGSTKWFWVETYYNAWQDLGANGWVKKEARLLAQGEYCNIWVWANDVDRNAVGMANLTEANAKALAAKFDVIYPAETNLIGFEYGGEQGQPPGGKDGDTRVQILCYHMLDSSGDDAGLAGYFWGKDYYPENYYSNQKSNEAEIFYIEEDMAESRPDFIYSTLVHEFQHMIHFNQKSVKQVVSGGSDTWYNEMLSLMTEDVMSTLIGTTLTNSENKLKIRVPYFLRYYDQVGITDWNSNQSTYYYAMAISFGAYLLRNYGGPELLRKLVTNNQRNIDSLNLALGELYNGLTFEQVLARFGETLIFTEQTTDPGVVTFNKSVVQSLSGVNGTYTYTAEAFNVWSTFGSGSSSTPLILNTNQKTMRPYSMSVHQDPTWKSKIGNVTINLEKPSDPNVLLFLMVK